MHDLDGQLRLLARDEDDVAVVSALLQDAIIPGADMEFKRKTNQFFIVANRFCWEIQPLDGVTSSDGKPVHQRRLCGICIRHVTAVQHHNWPDMRQDALFNLLALRYVGMAKHTGEGVVLQLEFSGGSSLRLLTDDIDITLADLDAGHPTSLQPAHDV
ncbi:DUF2948 family protein [Alphaproteobacteria bacterium]|nr:DUF2948 family protein [Alphaproteobacteria bacterium]